MPLLTLKNIGKIYVSEGNVAVGIRGINLSFEKGEFVAVTGKSGSGKSTLLNVISGIDSYEEGELYIEDQPTSHYRQLDWEEYREKYISFIFQDYNIIDSFTVLQNVELALMHIDSAIKRRKRAVELLTRVGMEKFLHQRGSKLSGGQKQRTVIARALAKDSPIILADEPTGNLDSATAKEIIELLKEVSENKLLIIVTHNFDQVSEYATRQIRIFDGGVEFDRVEKKVESQSESVGSTEKAESKEGENDKKRRKLDLKKGIVLGWSIFTSMPKLSVFLCLLMIISALGLFFTVTSYYGSNDSLVRSTLFTYKEGRVVLIRQAGEVPSAIELEKWVNGEKGAKAKSYLRCDYMLDNYISLIYSSASDSNSTFYCGPSCTYGESFGSGIIGRYPQKDDEVFLYLPISYQPSFGNELPKKVSVDDTISLTAVGVKYYYDNNLNPKALFTEEGFKTLTAIRYLQFNQHNLTLSVSVNGVYQIINAREIFPVYGEEKKIYVKSYDGYDTYYSAEPVGNYFDFSHYADYRTYDFRAEIPVSYLDNDTYIDSGAQRQPYKGEVLVSTALIKEWMEEGADRTYKQASLFFESDSDARAAVSALQADGYVAVVSDVSYQLATFDAFLSTIFASILALLGIGFILFFAFFISLVTNRAMGAFKGDMAIMRSMGISVRTIKQAMYVRMLISILPALPAVAIVAILIFINPFTNGFFRYIYAGHYLLIFFGLLLISLRVTRLQVKKLFKVSVKKSIKGGEEA